MFPGMMPMGVRIEQQQREKELMFGKLASMNDSVRAELKARQFEDAAFLAKNDSPARSINIRSLFHRPALLRLQRNLK